MLCTLDPADWGIFPRWKATARGCWYSLGASSNHLSLSVHQRPLCSNVNCRLCVLACMCLGKGTEFDVYFSYHSSSTSSSSSKFSQKKTLFRFESFFLLWRHVDMFILDKLCLLDTFLQNLTTDDFIGWTHLEIPMFLASCTNVPHSGAFITNHEINRCTDNLVWCEKAFTLLLLLSWCLN